MAGLKWTNGDSALALQEGWDVFRIHNGSDGRPWAIEKLDDPETFATDEDAWRHVLRGANEGKLLHLKALIFLLLNAPAEYDAIIALDDSRAIVERTAAFARWSKGREVAAA